MNNLEYLEKIKDKNVDYKTFKEVGEHEIEYRKAKALEIIAETLISIDRNIEFMAIPYVDIPEVPNIVIQDMKEAQKKVKK